jgi:hypothetical chaperone protein
LLRSARDSEKVALLLKVWRQRLSYRLVRSAEESKIALSAQPSVTAGLPFISDELATAISQQGLEAALDQPLARIMEQVQLALDNSNEKPDVIYLTGGSARSPLIKKRWRRTCRVFRLPEAMILARLPPGWPAGRR